jgi:trimethylamine--corrinoid protein Co-methyltransferase
LASIEIRALSEDETQQVHAASLRVLREVGVDVCHERIRSRLLPAGASGGAGNARVCIPAEMVEEALSLCPRDILVGTVRGDKHRMEPGSRLYSSCVVDPFILDYEEGRRPPRLADCRTNARLVDAIDAIIMPYKMDLDYSDATGHRALLESNLAFMSSMSKHYVCAPHSRLEARCWMEMSEIMAGCSLRENRIVSALISPTSPLTFDKPLLELIEFLLPFQIMLIMLPCPQAGATSPFTIAGTVVDFNVENLATIVIVQTLHPGTPVHYHNVAMGFDMRKGLSSLGGPEKTLCAIAGVDMGRFYNLSSGCAGTATNCALYDFQNGAESMSQLLLAGASRANLITGIGSLGNGMVTSPEQILFDCDLIALAEYLSDGVRVDAERLSVGSIVRIGPGGDFLQDLTTLKLLRTGEHFYTGSFGAADLEEPNRTMVQHLHERAREILERHEPAVPTERLEALHKYVREQEASEMPE